MFTYGHFGSGFTLARPDWTALRVAALLRRRGEEVMVIRRTRTGVDAYGNPTISEANHSAKAFVEVKADQTTTQAGDVAIGELRLYLQRWAALEAGWDVEVHGALYRVTSVELTQAYLKATAERRRDA